MPWKSGMSTSMRQPGTRARVARIVSAKIDAPPSARSSRSTDVMTAYCRRMRVDRFRDARRLRGVELRRPSVRHGAIRARTGADVAEDHERRRAVMPAFADVGAAGVLADRVQPQVLHDALEAEVVLRPRSADLQPLGLRLTRPHEFKRRFDGHCHSILSDEAAGR